jgi:hypothetical protein
MTVWIGVYSDPGAKEGDDEISNFGLGHRGWRGYLGDGRHIRPYYMAPNGGLDLYPRNRRIFYLARDRWAQGRAATEKD